MVNISGKTKKDVTFILCLHTDLQQCLRRTRFDLFFIIHQMKKKEIEIFDSARELQTKL